MASVLSPYMNDLRADHRRFYVAAACSLAIHALLGGLLVAGTSYPDRYPMPTPLSVSLAPLPDLSAVIPSVAQPRKQIVSEPLSPKEPPQKETNRLAEHDHRAEREQIARGTGNDPVVRPGVVRLPALPASQPVRPQPAKPKQEKAKEQSGARSANRADAKGEPSPPRVQDRPAPRAPEPAHRVVSPGNLRLDSEAVLSRFGSGSSAESPSRRTRATGAAAADTTNSRLDAALSAPAGMGSADNISGIHDGSVTLLNAKADKYAVFVRRVAYRVFGTLRESGWTSLSAGHVRAIGRPVVVIAELSPRGAFISARVRQPSGSPRFDALVSAAVQQSVSDPNPPSGAVAADGRIRFIFHSTSTVSIGPSGPQGFPSERRWLELGTGLD